MFSFLLVSATKFEHHDKELFGHPIHIIGVGKVEAAINTYKLIQKYRPDHVINFGSCGNLKNHKIGEVLKIGTVYDDFHGCVVPEHEPIEVSYSPYGLFTTDTFYDTGSTYGKYYTEMTRKCDVVDMEGYSIAKVCRSQYVSVSLYKWVSDDGSSSDWEANAAVGYDNFKAIFKQWLEQQK
jgi:adenosylhomocysteine nucleosidase